MQRQLGFDWKTDSDHETRQEPVTGTPAAPATARPKSASVPVALETERLPARPQSGATAYPPSHPWHYLAAGDAQPPPRVEDIMAARFTDAQAGFRLAGPAGKRQALLLNMLRDQQEQLDADIARYRALTERGVACLSRYDREIAYGGDDELALASSLALKHNHIAYGKGRIAWLRSKIPRGLLALDDAAP